MTRDRKKYKQEFISTGSLGLDIALGGGWPVGFVSELSGPPDSGKSTLVNYAIKNVQAGGERRIVGLVDAHGTFNHAFAEHVGVELERLIVVRSVKLIKEIRKFCSFIVVDPLLASDDLPLLAQTTLVTSELRKNLGQRSLGSYARTGGLQETSARVSLRGSLREGIQTAEFKVEEAAFEPPAGAIFGKFDITSEGIDHALEVLDVAVSLGLIHREFNWYHFLGWITPAVNGRANAADWLRKRPKVMAAMEGQIRNQ
jgi:recombination protein RecA